MGTLTSRTKLTMKCAALCLVLGLVVTAAMAPPGSISQMDAEELISQLSVGSSDLRGSNFTTKGRSDLERFTRSMTAEKAKKDLKDKTRKKDGQNQELDAEED